MKLVSKTEFDIQVQQNSRISVQDFVPGVLELSFGPTKVQLAEDSARDFLYQLAGYLAQKELEDYSDDSPEYQESRDTWVSLSLLPQELENPTEVR